MMSASKWPTSWAFGKQLLCDITGADVAGYQKARQCDGVAGR
jgi:hypothetical protein